MSNIIVKYTDGKRDSFYGVANAIDDVFLIITDDDEHITIPKSSVRYIKEW